MTLLNPTLQFTMNIECASCQKQLGSKPHTCLDGKTYPGILGLDQYLITDELKNELEKVKKERDEAIADANLSRGNLINAENRIKSLGKIITDYQNNTDVVVRDKRIKFLEEMLNVHRLTMGKPTNQKLVDDLEKICYEHGWESARGNAFVITLVNNKKKDVLLNMLPDLDNMMMAIEVSFTIDSLGRWGPNKEDVEKLLKHLKGG